MRKYVLPVFDTMVYGSFAAFMALMALSIPGDVRMRLLAGIWEMLRRSGGF